MARITLTPAEAAELFPMCPESEPGHVLRNRRMRTVQQRALELFLPKLPPFYRRRANFLTLLRNLRDVLGGTLLVDDKYVGGGSAPAQQRPMNGWDLELQRRCPVRLCPEADFSGSLFPTLQPLAEGASSVPDFDGLFVEVVFPYDVPEPSYVGDRDGGAGGAWDFGAAQSAGGAPSSSSSPSPSSSSSSTTTTWSTTRGDALTRLAVVFVPPPRGAPAPVTLRLREWHPEFFAAPQADAAAAAAATSTAAPPSSASQRPPIVPEVTAWVLTVAFRGFDDKNFIELRMSSADPAVAARIGNQQPIAVRCSVVYRVTLLSSGHLLVTDAIRHKVFGRIDIGQDVVAIACDAAAAAAAAASAYGGDVGFERRALTSSSSFAVDSNASFGASPSSSPMASPPHQQQREQAAAARTADAVAAARARSFFDIFGVAVTGCTPDEPTRFMSLGFAVIKSAMRQYEHACDADCPLAWNDVLYPERCSKVQS
jgi:hypothetical protein